MFKIDEVKELSCIHDYGKKFAAMIISGPQHQIVAPDDKILFTCIAQGEFVFWLIDKLCPCNETIKAKFEERGFHFLQDGEHNKTISVEATRANNGTIISCTAVEESEGKLVSHAFQEGSLIIAGKLNMTQYLSSHRL